MALPWRSPRRAAPETVHLPAYRKPSQPRTQKAPAIPPAPSCAVCPQPSSLRSEPRLQGQVKVLFFIEVFFLERFGEVKAQRAKAGGPQKREADDVPERPFTPDNCTGCAGVGVVQPPQVADIIEKTTPQTDLFRQPQRELCIKTRDRVIIAAEEVVVIATRPIGGLIARTNTTGFKAAQNAGGQNKSINRPAKAITLPAEGTCFDGCSQSDFIVQDAALRNNLGCGAHILLIAAKPGVIGANLKQEAAVGIQPVQAAVVGVSKANGAGVLFTLRNFAANDRACKRCPVRVIPPADHLVHIPGIADLKTGAFRGIECQRRREECPFGVILREAGVRFGQTEIQVKPQIAAKQEGFGKAKSVFLGVLRCRDIERQTLPATQEVVFRQPQSQTKTVIDGIRATKAQRTGWLFNHVHINDNLAGRAAFANLDLCSFKETERADAFCAFADFARVEGIALNRAELPTDDAIQCGCVSFNVDPLDKDARSTGQDKFDIQRQITVIARDPRLGTQEVDPLADCERLQSGDRVFDKRWIVDNTGAQTQDIAELIRVCL
mmetsp:Transcript_3194/g.4271  ORF Transcript_3194/g.4271 Transcript_3194/m.4271 type:complete len:551 (+) Transcript_3194:218-1870(+)